MTCTTCDHGLLPLEGGEVDPDTGAHEALCAVWGEDHGTHWLEREDS